MKARVTPVGAIRFGPVWRDPAGPAKLPELRESHRFNRSRRDCQFDLPLELVPDIEKNDVGERLAALSGRKIGHVFVHRFDEDADTELVLDAVGARAEQHPGAERAVTRADRGAVGRLKGKARPDKL